MSITEDLRDKHRPNVLLPAARLRISGDGEERVVPFGGDEMTIGRAPENDVCIGSRVVSNAHAKLIREGADIRFVQLGGTNPTLLRGVSVTDIVLRHGDRLEIVPGTPEVVAITIEIDGARIPVPADVTQPFRIADARASASIERFVLPGEGRVTIGRAPDNDLVLAALSVSRRHAHLDIAQGAVRLVDEESANGTYVNGVTTLAAPLHPGDVVRIGPYRLVYREGAIEHNDDSRSVRLDVHAVSKRAGAALLLDAISFEARPGEILAIAGTSGAGKSTLIDALNGSRRPTSGRILINGVDLYASYAALRPLIGYVPQATILPAQLTMRRALYYVARLRLPPDVTMSDARSRVDDVLRDLDLYERRDVPIEKLSGGQQKRASIAAELLSNPGLLFLDEPTSGLDPGLTRRAMTLLRDLAKRGGTVVVVTHDVESILASDRVVFLGAGGRLVFDGTPAAAMAHFKADDFAQIYQIVESGDSAEWAENFRANSSDVRPRPAPHEPPASDAHASRPWWDPVALVGAGVRRGTSTWRQFRTTTLRYLESLVRDRKNLALLIAQAPAIAVFLALVAGRGDLAPPPDAAVQRAAEFGIPAASLGAALPLMLAASATWFGAINASREIVKELPILRREWLAGLRIPPYMASKVCVLMAMCMVQTFVLLGIVALSADVPSDGALMWGPLELWITLDLAAFAALGLGLVISASVSNADRAQSLVPILLIPQLIFAGKATATGVEQWLSYLTITHWATEAMKITARVPYQEQAGGYAVSDLLVRWGVLAAMTLVFVGFAGWNLRRQQSA
ncbi:MAG TPA: ATP-binding cassette domain-containing protein [Dehalococcoidia bacterium]